MIRGAVAHGFVAVRLMPSGSQVLAAVCLREGLITEKMSACFGES